MSSSRNPKDFEGNSSIQPIDTALEERIFAKYSAMLSVPSLSDTWVSIVCRDETEFLPAIALSNAAGCNVSVFNDLKAASSALRSKQCKSHLLIVDVSCEGLDATFDGLVGIRRNQPGISIVLASTAFSKSDFSEERLAIADSSLRIPFSYESFEKAVCAASINNRKWRELQPVPVDLCSQGQVVEPMSPWVQNGSSFATTKRDSSLISEMSGVNLERERNYPARPVCDEQMSPEYGRWPSGWWLLPSVILGLLAWLSIFWITLRHVS